VIKRQFGHVQVRYQGLKNLALIDLSPIIPWLFVGLGLPLGFRLGRRLRSQRGIGRLFSAGTVAFGLGIALSFATSAMHTVCIETFRLCVSRGDGNMSYWFHSLVAFPLYWALIYAPRTSEAVALAATTRCDNAVLAALAQYQSSATTSQFCPSCSERISVSVCKPPNADARSMVQTTCACGKCNGTFALKSQRA